MSTRAADDLVPAIGIAVGAVVVGSFLPWMRTVSATAAGTDGAGNASLLLAGIAGACVAHWHLTGRTNPRLLVSAALLCGSVSLYLVSLVARTSHPLGGLLLTTTAAVMATVLAGVARYRNPTRAA